MGIILQERGAEVNILNRIVSILLAEAIILCHIVSYRLIINPYSAANVQSTAMLIIFNVLFMSLMFQIQGSLNRKLCLLTSGNVIGLCWNLIFNFFNVAGIVSFGETFNIFYTVFFPFLSSLWMVSFWSLSLTILHKSTIIHRKFSFDY